jgi:pyruvate,orthophosphate dikinase
LAIVVERCFHTINKTDYFFLVSVVAFAVFAAACQSYKEGNRLVPEIMIPLVGTTKELSILKANAIRVASEVMQKWKVKLDYKIGTMIEIPRAAITANEIAEHADFFSFGTNDLTQMTWGFSRDDIGSFLPDYISQQIVEIDPFQSLDQNGVGQLMQMALEKAKPINAKSKRE